MLEGEAEADRGTARGIDEVGRIGLGEVDDPAVVPEVVDQKLGVAIEPQAPDDQSIEVPHQEVGQVERPGFLVGKGREAGRAGIHLVAMGAGQAFDSLLREHAIEEPACTAVGVGDEDPVVGPAGRLDPSRTAARDPPGRLWRSAGRQLTSTPGRPGQPRARAPARRSR